MGDEHLPSIGVTPAPDIWTERMRRSAEQACRRDEEAVKAEAPAPELARRESGENEKGRHIVRIHGRRGQP
jgi:hypothetical protein